MKNELYLATHDCVSDPMPRKCTVINRVQKRYGSGESVLVEVSPPLPAAFQGGPIQEFDRIILAFLGGRTIGDVGSGDVVVDIVVCPRYAGGLLDERACSRMGTGSLHSIYEEALQPSPLEER
jgi:hypothetical protein